jgi:hypothetical protein
MSGSFGLARVMAANTVGQILARANVSASGLLAAQDVTIEHSPY